MDYKLHALIDDIILKEGGYVDHPYDRGGPTKYGITMSTLKQYQGGDVSKEDIQHLDLETAKQIYLTMYWFRPKINELPECLHHIMFDICVNSGQGNAGKILQRAINAIDGKDQHVRVDGIIGPKTRERVLNVYQRLGKSTFLDFIINERVKFYTSIVDMDPTQKVFLNGWINRALSFKE